MLACSGVWCVLNNPHNTCALRNVASLTVLSKHAARTHTQSLARSLDPNDQYEVYDTYGYREFTNNPIVCVLFHGGRRQTKPNLYNICEMKSRLFFKVNAASAQCTTFIWFIAFFFPSSVASSSSPLMKHLIGSFPINRAELNRLRLMSREKERKPNVCDAVIVAQTRFQENGII